MSKPQITVVGNNDAANPLFTTLLPPFFSSPYFHMGEFSSLLFTADVKEEEGDNYGRNRQTGWKTVLGGLFSCKKISDFVEIHLIAQ